MFQKALKDAFEVFINKEVNSKHSNAEMICTFCDRLLKSGGEKVSDAEIEDSLEKVVQLFSFITDKDLFGEMYRCVACDLFLTLSGRWRRCWRRHAWPVRRCVHRNLLAKRLLGQRSASNDAERSMLSKLKLRCGAQFTGKMEGMLSDLAVGSDHERCVIVCVRTRMCSLEPTT